MTKEEYIKQIEDVKVEWNTLDKAYWKLIKIANQYFENIKNGEDTVYDLFEGCITEDDLNSEVQWRAEHDGWRVVWEYLRPIQASNFTVFYSDRYIARNLDEEDINWIK